MATLGNTNNPTTKPGGFVETSVKWALGTLILLVVNQMIGMLPMLKDLTVQGLPIPALDLVQMVVRLGILALVLVTARELASRLRTRYPGSPQWAMMIHLLGLFLTAAYGHRFLSPLAEPVAGDWLWIYHLIFAVMAVVPFSMMLLLLFRNLPVISQAVIAAGRALVTINPQVECVECHQLAPQGARFCPACGSQFSAGQQE